MIDQTNTTEPDAAEGVRAVDTPADDQGTDQEREQSHADSEADEQEPDGRTKAGREAARYRVKLRETEEARTAAEARAEAAQRAFAEHLANAHRVTPKALWASGITLADVLDADGNVDPAKVTTACDYARRELDLQWNGPDMGQGQRGGNTAAAWADAFRRPDVKRG